jgi:hypothetical protein
MACKLLTLASLILEVVSVQPQLNDQEGWDATSPVSHHRNNSSTRRADKMRVFALPYSILGFFCDFISIRLPNLSFLAPLAH